MTPLKSLAHACNLSLKDTAAFLHLPESTVRAYWHGSRNSGPQLITAIRQLNQLSRHVDRLSGELISEIGRIAPRKPQDIFLIILATHATLKASKPLGMPFPSVYGAILSRVMAQLPPELAIRVVFDPEATDDLEVR